MKRRQITVLGIGNILFTDEGVGIRVVERLQELYEFPKNVSIIDGGVLGLSLMHFIAEADYLIVIDAIKNKGEPGSLYRLEGEDVPKRILAKNSLHQIDFLETLTSCQMLDMVPETVILGVEPLDIETLSIELTPIIHSKINALMDMVLKELERLGVDYRPMKEMKRVSGYTSQDYQD